LDSRRDLEYSEGPIGTKSSTNSIGLINGLLFWNDDSAFYHFLSTYARRFRAGSREPSFDENAYVLDQDLG
jgi:hypothetical protein